MKQFFRLFLFILPIIVGCRQSVPKADLSASSISVTDFRNKKIAIPKPATRIICLIESALSGLYMLGAEESVVGVSSCVYNESSAPYYALLDERIMKKELPSPGNWDFVNIESVAALKPDLVIIWSSQEESISAMEALGIPVYGVFLKSFADVHKEIRDLGKLTGKLPRADSLIAFVENEIATIRRQPVNTKKSVYFMWAQGLFETAGKTSTVNEMIELAGANNACPVNMEHVVTNMENITEWNPDIIVLSFNCRLKPEDIFQMPEWKNITAIKNKFVFQSDELFYADLWTLKYPLAVMSLARQCYPENYKIINEETERNRIISFLYGKRGHRLIEKVNE
jgi:iron complex transport system substrate-binding protein